MTELSAGAPISADATAAARAPIRAARGPVRTAKSSATCCGSSSCATTAARSTTSPPWSSPLWAIAAIRARTRSAICSSGAGWS